MLNVPFSVPLALWVGIMSQFIPVVGTYIAGALPILITLIDTPRTGLFVLLVVLAYQQIENYLFAPKVTAQTMEIHVAVAYGSVLVGPALLGVVGALWPCRSPPRCRRSSPATGSISRWKRTPSQKAPPARRRIT